jgi:hypothetical protein
MVNPPSPGAGTAAAASQMPREVRNILRAYRAAEKVLPLDLDIDKVKEHLTQNEIRLADAIQTKYDNIVLQLPVHPGIDNNLSLGNYPLHGAAKNVGVMLVWLANMDPERIQSVNNLVHLLKCLRYKDHNGNPLIQVDLCFTKERVVRGGGAVIQNCFSSHAFLS